MEQNTSMLIAAYKKRIEVMREYLNGKQIEERGTEPLDNWKPFRGVFYWDTHEYRVKTVFPSVDWSAISPKWKCLVVHKNNAFLATDLPSVQRPYGAPFWEKGMSYYIGTAEDNLLASFDIGCNHSEFVVVARPGEQEIKK